MRADIIQKLTQAGLSDKEARVYVSMLQLGPTGAGEISRYASVSRATTYLALASLGEQGLASSYDDGKQAVFSAETPRRLAEIAERDVRTQEKRHADISSFVPELDALFRDSSKPVVRFYEGEQGLRNLREWIARQRAARYDSFIRLNRQLQDVARHDEERRLETIHPDTSHRIIYVPDKDATVPSFSPERARKLQIRFAGNIPFDFDGEIGILDGSAYLASVTPHVHICVIESAGLARLLLTQFELAWHAASDTRVDH